MHGLINRSIQHFVIDTYGLGAWEDATMMADLGFDNFEALLPYDDALTLRLLESITAVLNKPREILLEDLGTYLVSHPHLEPLRRLLRFGGVNFLEFLYSLDDLHDRAKLAVPELDLPILEIADLGAGDFSLTSRWTLAGSGNVFVGILRAMADDYGDLVTLEHGGSSGCSEVVNITVFQHEFTDGRAFELAAGGATP